MLLPPSLYDVASDVVAVWIAVMERVANGHLAGFPALTLSLFLRRELHLGLRALSRLGHGWS